MSIVSSCCEFCDCYTVACDQCGRHANKCGKYDQVAAVERARIAGYKTVYINVSSPAIWLCPTCHRSNSEETKAKIC